MKTFDYIPFGDSDVLQKSYEEAVALILPIYYEASPSYGPGSREGAYHILRASAELETMDEETFMDWGEVGIHTLPPFMPKGSPDTAMQEICSIAEPVLKSGKFLMSIGGDHAVAIGLAMAAAKAHPEVGILQIDAHLDLREEWNNSWYNHACVMRRIADDLKLPFVQVGIRSFSKKEAEYIRSNRLSPVYAHEINMLNYSWIDKAIDRLPDTVYLTFDLDGLDPSVIPGTGTPEPGGLSYRQAVELIRRLGKKKKVLGADINELAKIEGTQVSEFTAAKLVTKILLHCV